MTCLSHLSLCNWPGHRAMCVYKSGACVYRLHHTDRDAVNILRKIRLYYLLPCERLAKTNASE